MNGVTETITASKDLLEAIKTPSVVASLDIDRWDLLIRQARRTRLLSRIAEQTVDNGLLQMVPPKVSDILIAARFVAAANRRMVAWEASQIREILKSVDTPIVLLKGAAYVASNLPLARGRISGDIDILVPRAVLEDVENALLKCDWQHIKMSDYDQRYYRSWMHELPPLRHAHRGTVVDIHHSILPKTSRLNPNIDELWRAAREIPGSDLRILGPHDMVLHSAAHLFQDGEINLALRDLVDIIDLLNHFGGEADFWEGLVERARVHQLQQPLFYALRYGATLLDLNVPTNVANEMLSEAPRQPALKILDQIIPRVLVPDHPDRPSKNRANLVTLLYVRSHWLRMPIMLLMPHIFRKFVIKLWNSYEDRLSRVN